MQINPNPIGVAGMTNPGDDKTFPILQKRLVREDGSSDLIVNYLPGSEGAAYAGRILELADVHEIEREKIEHLANILGAPVTDTFTRRVHDVIIGFSVIIEYNWRSPRWHKQFYKQLKTDPLGTSAKHRGDVWAQLLIRKIWQDAGIDLQNPFAVINAKHTLIKVVRWYEDQMKPLDKPGPEKASNYFWLAVAAIAADYDDLTLPQADDSRRADDKASTPFYDFAVAMRDVLIAHAPAFLSADVAAERFERMRSLEGRALIKHLSIAQREIRKQNQ